MTSLKLMTLVSPVGFRQCFLDWSQAFNETCEGEVIAVDGKTAKGSRDKQRNRSPLHMVSAWACRNRWALAQEATDEKSNEITAIPKLLELLELKGALVTIDAMGCQRAIAEQVIDQQGDYVLGLKGNQGTRQSKTFSRWLAPISSRTLRTITWNRWIRIMAAWKFVATGSANIWRPYHEPNGGQECVALV